MSLSKRWALYVSEPSDETQADDAEALAWRYHEEVELPELASDTPPRYFADFDQMLRDAESGGCQLCGSPVEQENAILCDSCRLETMEQIEALHGGLGYVQ